MKKFLIIIIILICIAAVFFFLAESGRQIREAERAEQAAERAAERAERAAEQAWIDLNGNRPFYDAALKASKSGHMSINEAVRYLKDIQAKGLTDEVAIKILNAKIGHLSELKANRPK